MKKVTANEIILIQEALLRWYDVHGRKFPWRAKRLSHYKLIVTEVLLQRTKAETVAKLYSSFFRQYQNWRAIAEASILELEKALKPIGLQKQRAKRLQRLAEEMVNRYGFFPYERKELEGLPMMGQYIANAVERLIYNRPAPLIDVNMARVLERLFGKRKHADIRNDVSLQGIAWRIVDHKDAREINWAIIDLASSFCKGGRLNPKCNECCLKETCKYYESIFQAK